MKSTEVRMPNFDVNESKAVVTELKHKDGTKVVEGEQILTAENTKSINEIEAPCNGYIAYVCAQFDEKQAGDCLAIIFETEEDYQAYVSHQTSDQAAAAVQIDATKKAVQLAEKLGVQLELIARQKGDGTIRTEDVQRYYDQTNQKSAASMTPVFRYDRERTVIVGAGKGAEVVIDILLDDFDRDIIGLVDDNVREMQNYHYPIFDCGVFDFPESIDKGRYDTVIISIGATLNTMKLRRRIFEEYRKYEIPFTNAISKNCEIRRGVKIGSGNIIGANTYIGTMTVVGDNNSIGYGTCLGHHNMVGNHNLIAPGCMTSGSVNIGDSCILPAGIAVRNRISIGNNVIVPLGYAIQRDLQDDTVIRENIHGDH